MRKSAFVIFQEKTLMALIHNFNLLYSSNTQNTNNNAFVATGKLS